MKILYIDAVGPFGGASRSLYEAIKPIAFEKDIDPYFIMQAGTSVKMYGKISNNIIQVPGLTRFDNTRASYYRGIRWVILIREIIYIPFTIYALLKAKFIFPRIDAIHVNEVLELGPGLAAKFLFRAPLIVHVRSLQRVDKSSWRTRIINNMLNLADAVIAIDENVRSTIPAELNVDVIHNSFSPQNLVDFDLTIKNKLASLRPDSLKVGFVGNIHRHKGIYELLDAATILRDQGKFDVEFLIVGGTTISDSGVKAWFLTKLGFAQNIKKQLQQEVRRRRLTEGFHLLGPTIDIQPVYECLDVLCFPSYYDAPGRPVFEAAFSGVPSIVCVNNPKPDTLIHGLTGVAIPTPNPQDLVNVISYFAENRHAVTLMGINAKKLAEENFTASKNSLKLFGLYRRVCRKPF